jgi:hypothetical protein
MLDPHTLDPFDSATLAVKDDLLDCGVLLVSVILAHTCTLVK